MAAPAGLNGGATHEPADGGDTPAEGGDTPAEHAAARSGDGEAPAEAAGAGSEAAEPVTAVAAPAGPVEAEPAGPWPVPLDATGTAEAELAGTELVDGDYGAGGVPGEARTGRDMSPLAMAGIIIGVIALIGVAAGVLAVITHGFKPKTVVTYRPAAVFKLQPGECVNTGSGGLAVTVVSCGTPHDAEVFAAYQLTGSWPGSAGVKQEASDGCASRFGDYVNPQLATAALNQQFIYPNQQAWKAGERTVVCEISSSDGQLTGSVRKSALAA